MRLSEWILLAGLTLAGIAWSSWPIVAGLLASRRADKFLRRRPLPVELFEPWPGVERIDTVREQFPALPERLAYSVAVARARLSRVSS